MSAEVDVDNDQLTLRIAYLLDCAGDEGLLGDEIARLLGDASDADVASVYLRLGWLCGRLPARAQVIGGYQPDVAVGQQRFVRVLHG